jgi:hypothetical protein
VISAGDGRAENDVCLAGMAMQKRVEPGQESHEHRHALASAQLAQVVLQ